MTAQQRQELFAEPANWVPQWTVEQVLRAQARELTGVSLRFGWRLLEGAMPMTGWWPPSWNLA